LIVNHYRPSLSNWQGRATELAQIQDWLSDMSVRLVGITGLGGYGKSTIAAKVLEENEQKSNFSKILWLKLAQFYNFSVWGRGLLKLLDKSIDEQVNDEALIHALVHNLSQQRCLLILDNLESLLQEDRQWQDEAYQQFLLRWLEHGQVSTLLITSRERPEIPLNMLPRSKWLDGLSGLPFEEGEALLRGLGIQGESSEIQTVVQRVDGHPLLLELIAGTLVDENEYPHINQLEQDLIQLVGLHQGDQETSRCGRE
jgi:NB-ARC domain